MASTTGEVLVQDSFPTPLRNTLATHQLPSEQAPPYPAELDLSAMQLAYILRQEQFQFPEALSSQLNTNDTQTSTEPRSGVEGAQPAPDNRPDVAATATTLQEESEGLSTDKPSKPDATPPDPHVSAFLQEALGPVKWATFRAKLFERRLGGSKVRVRKKKTATNPEVEPPVDDAKTRSTHGATVIEFLIKTEVVKEVLRTFVPHPYNPLKSLSHSYDGSPTGTVVLTRSAILQLCGWSNTQFSYWTRRSEAIACLSQHDERLAKVRAVLEERMSNGHWGVNLTNEEAKAADEASIAALGVAASAVEDIVTGKGIDAIVEQVKKRTGASQFIRGKHASLDPFGKILGDDFAHGLGNLALGLDTARTIPTRGGFGGVRITDIRKRTAEAKQKGEAVPLEFILAEEEAARLSAAKAAGKGRRGPGRSKGTAGGDNHGVGTSQSQVEGQQGQSSSGNSQDVPPHPNQADAVGGAGPSHQDTQNSTSLPQPHETSSRNHEPAIHPTQSTRNYVPHPPPSFQYSETSHSFDLDLPSMGLALPPLPQSYHLPPGHHRIIDISPSTQGVGPPTHSPNTFFGIRRSRSELDDETGETEEQSFSSKRPKTSQSVEQSHDPQ